MNRWLKFLACIALGVVMLVCGLLVPVHLRAVDDRVIKMAGRDTPTLMEQGLALVDEHRLGVARIYLQAAQVERLSGWGQLGLEITNAAAQHPGWLIWGNDASLERAFGDDALWSGPITGFIVEREHRETALKILGFSPNPAMQELLRCRELTGTVLFPPSQSASGQAFDAAVSICGLLLAEGRLTTGFGDSINKLSATANRNGNSLPLEQVLMDFMSLGQRFNWDQLVAFTGRIEDAGTLHTLADEVRTAGGQLPVLFATVSFSGRPAEVVKYFDRFGQTGMTDLGASLRYGAGGVNEVLRRGQLLYRTGYSPPLALGCSLHLPWLAFVLKWLAYLLGGFLFAAALHFARPAVSSLERPLQVRGFHVFREILFALGFLLVVLLLSEPFLAQEKQKEEQAFRLHLPTVGNVVPAGFVRAHPTIMNNIIILTLLLFFVLQGLIYIACLVKLAEIRRQQVPPRMKLRLLENEDHLFVAGLYLGFVGTILSLILVSMGVIKFSLMAAYSSTSFGVVFVCLFKIFNLRPARRRLILEAEAMESATREP